MSTSIFYSNFASPLGALFVQGDGSFVTGLYVPDHKGWSGPAAAARRDDASFAVVRDQLAEYFAGERTAFDVPLRLEGTPFQQRVWQELARIPFGATISYGELARRIGRPSASRAVGHANGRNPISILIPCHRVVGSTGRLTGYAGGLDRKAWMLQWERRALQLSPSRSRARQEAWSARDRPDQFRNAAGLAPPSRDRQPAMQNLDSHDR